MFIKIFTEPAILIITATFLFFIIMILQDYNKAEKNLKLVSNFLSSMDKKEISYRFNQLDEFMDGNSYTSIAWDDFKKALIFPEKLYAVSPKMRNGESYAPEVYLTVDASYFFNEESLIYSKINHKFIQVMPTLLTGLGPFFTFLKMAIAFTSVDFSVSATEGSLNGLISGIQIAALCSVFAVGYSLLFMFIEKVLYNRKCKRWYLSVQKELIRLFDLCTSESFLFDLLKESKVQGVNAEKLLKAIPVEFSSSISKSIGDVLTPYLENILYSLNRLNEQVDKSKKDDVVDKLF